MCQVGLLIAKSAFAEAPIYDTLRLSGAVLMRGESAVEARFDGEFTKKKAKQLPPSVALYLKPSQVINSSSDGVRKAARRVLRLLGSGATEQVSGDPALLAWAVRAWTEEAVTEPFQEAEREFNSDPRLALPKASEIIARGWGGHAARVRVRLALLRALGVPARACWFRGAAAVQYWAHELPDEAPPKAKPNQPTRPVGRWVLDEAAFPGELVDAWSMDPGDLPLAFWEPAQELRVDSHVERAFFSVSDTALAKDELDYVKLHGRLSPGARGRPMLAPRSVRGLPQPWLMLAVHQVRVVAEGPIAPLYPIDFLTPYRPPLRSWGREEHPGRLELLGQAFWTDRPERVRLRKGTAIDEWKSPPPALGMLHYASVSLRRPKSVLEARLLGGGQLSGKLLRADSLAPRSGWTVHAEFPGTQLPPLSTKTAQDGSFSQALSGAQLEAPWIKVSSGEGTKSLLSWDEVWIEGVKFNQFNPFSDY